jgi:replicative DNA helicase
MIARTLPNSLDAEENLLSCCFIDSDVIGKCVIGGIRADSFYEEKHAVVFGIILGLYNAQKPADPYIVAEELRASGNLDAFGGMPFLIQISKAQSTHAQAVYFIKRLRELATLRQVIRSATSAVERCYDTNGDFNETMTEIADSISRATSTGDSIEEETMQAVARQLLSEVEMPMELRKAKAAGVPWGLIDLDAACGNLDPGTLTVLAGMPSAGKSALADQVAWGAAAKGKNTLIFTYEMTKRDKAIRIAQQVSRLNYDQFDAAPTDRKIAFTEAVRAIMDCKSLHVFERDVSVNRLVARCRAFSSRSKVGLIVVDFLQYLARLESTIGRERTDEKLGRLTAGVKQIAKECNCPALLLSSLNREGYKDGIRPTLASLRSSGEIESDADVVGILHWPESDPITKQVQDPKDSGQSRFYVEFNQEKGRSKGVHQVGLSFDRRSTRFDNYSR